MKMIKVTIQGTVLEAALLSPKVAKKYEEGIKRTVDRANAAKDNPIGYKAIEEQCEAVIDLVDDIFGAGSAKKVFGEETDLITCLDAFKELTEMYEKQVNPIMKKYTGKAQAKKENDSGDA